MCCGAWPGGHAKPHEPAGRSAHIPQLPQLGLHAGIESGKYVAPSQDFIVLHLKHLWDLCHACLKCPNRHSHILQSRHMQRRMALQRAGGISSDTSSSSSGDSGTGRAGKDGSLGEEDNEQESSDRSASSSGRMEEADGQASGSADQAVNSQRSYAGV